MTEPAALRWGARWVPEGWASPGPTSDVVAWQANSADPAPPDDTGAGGPPVGLDGLDELGGGGPGGDPVQQVRVVLDWARLEPANAQVDDAAVEDLRNALTLARERGLEVWGCLHDGSLPGWFAHDERGFPDERSRRYFWARHVETVGEALGDLVDGWVPIHEPSRWASRGWLDAAGPPGRREDAEGFARNLEGVYLAALEAAQRLRGSGRPVATAQWLMPAFAAPDEPGAPVTPQAEAAASVVDETMWRSWVRMFTEEVLVIPGRSPVPVPGARQAFDLVGFTYRHGVAVRGDGALAPYPAGDPPPPWPEGLALVLHRLAEELPDHDLMIAGAPVPSPWRTNPEVAARYAADVRSIALDGRGDGIPLRALWW